MSIPFVILFRTPNGYYFFDVNKNEFVNVQKSSFQYLERLLNGEKSTEPIPEELAKLQGCGYLATKSSVEEIRHPYSKFISTFLDRKLPKITLQLTQNCNFRCKYCVYSEEHNMKQRTHSNKRMSWETAKKAVDFLLAHSADSPDVNIGFYGGEPLLEFPFIQQIVEYSERVFSGKKLTFNITTNGSLLTDEIIRYFEKHDVSLMISLDGPKEINDKNRVFADGRGTFETVMDHIARVREIAPKYAEKLQISMVMDPLDDFDCINAICLEGHDINQLNIMASIVDQEYDGKETEFSEAYTYKFEYQRFLSILSALNRFPKSKVSPIVYHTIASTIADNVKFDAVRGLRKIDAPSGPCVPGQMRLFIDTSGRFFPCERVSEKSPAMCIGRLDKGFDFEQTDHLLNIAKLTEKTCKNCWCFRYCTICAKKCDVGASELSGDAKLSFCQESKDMAYSKLRQYLLFRELPFFYADQTRLVRKEGTVA
ncbi:Cys-rich peptide radical SAM maturase CcpM [Caproicibacter fermentans]|uniref:Cys-rich peptide radical SAM maturase CcpM n=1 Tax=Caproicibacter fermentans TaxID=2576756 RepID=A0A7G8TC55_9FIRM|nr:Cys-rich peptide radical SAM maturase CcpM [Caproicibacter fermentans]QNK41196.1 Cys-rich peptide radical SAM maturase CcpM [Caproicibacter fermentans]